ncbi:hypothetical protein N7457_007534 [Penicillium paradoxum]|uniref:uncharacterized protein n=1 Tax=Penicillium paradoxum TaxID=176176 RepID=UPI00254756D3|nr:uncharacterized protein N7457_007534 [Penicillium paradoxum]KAJ5779814.1 hypothetical protein N7457_007534 [Penicillium paradoxum]
MDRPKAKYSNGSGRTCQNCARAKIRCIRNEPTGSCDRCERLGKACHFREGRSIIPTTSSGETKGRLDALEAKVDQLLAQSGTLLPTNSSTATGTPASASAHPKDVIDQGLLSLDAANMLLQEFRATLMSYCPFVIIPPHATAETLRRDKPFLLLTILTVALHDNMPLQRTLEKQVKKAISDCMIFDGSVSFEILQGLLVHLAWCQYHSRPRRFSQYLHLGISIIADLQLDRPPEHRFWRTRVSFHDEKSIESMSWGREEKRAKRCAFPYLPYFENMCKTLATDAEHPSDKYLLHIVQLQQLSERISQASTQNLTGLHHPNFSLEQEYRQFRSELDLYRTNLPFPLTETPLLFMQCYTVDLYLCQITLFDHKPSAQRPPLESSFQIDVLRTGLTATKTLLDYYISLPLGCDVKFNNAGWVQLGFAVTLACKLVSAASEPFVHAHTVDLCQALDMSNMLKRCILRIQAFITPNMDASGDRNVFFHYEKRLKSVQWWFENRALSGPNNEYSQQNAQFTEGMDSTTGDTTRDLNALNSMGGFDNFNQWSGFFPDATIDGMYIDWMAQATTSFGQQQLG